MSNIELLMGGTIVSPFSRLRALLADVEPGHDRPIEMTIGEPHEAMPDGIMEKLSESAALFGKYPPVKGTPELRGAIAHWLGQRYGFDSLAGDRAIDPETEILPLNGSREGLFYAIFPAVARKRAAAMSAMPRSAMPAIASKASARDQLPAVLIPNPFYQVYAAAALAADCEPVYLPSTAASGDLPDLEALARNTDLLDRTVVFYLCSPVNPQGAIATMDYLCRALELARKYNFMLFSDECYSEIYRTDPPAGALEAAMQLEQHGGDQAPGIAAGSDRFANLIIFNSLSKRSNLPGLRSGFCAGDVAFLRTLLDFRNLAGPQMPLPTQHLSAAIWADERHVKANRQAYNEKFDIADELLGMPIAIIPSDGPEQATISLRGHLGYQRPAGGFFLWLNMRQLGGGIAAAVTLWKGCGVKVLPGAFLASDESDGQNFSADYVRIALVHDNKTIREALERIVTATF